MEQNKPGAGKPTIDKEYLKKLAEKIKAEKQKKANLAGQPPAGKPTKPAAPSIPQLSDDDEEEDMAAEKTAIIDLASLSGHAADARLIIIDGKDQGKSLDITRDEVYCGRSLDNDFVISDISVSRKHFKITHDGDHFTVHDIGSGNGIRVNGKKETEAVLYHNDVITAGARNVRFEILNEDILAAYSRHTEKIEEQVIVEHKSGSSAAIWVVLILLIGVIGAGGYYLFFYMPQHTQQPVAFHLGFEELDRVDELIEDQKLDRASRLISSYLSKLDPKRLKDRAQLKTRQKKIAEETKIKKAVDQAKKLIAAGKAKEAETLLRPTPPDSVFFKTVRALVGTDKVIQWRLDEVSEMMKKKKVDLAVSTLTELLVDYPDNKKIRAMRDKIVGTVGETKLKKIQEEVAKKKEAEARKKAEKLKKRKRRIAAAKRRKAARKRKAAARRKKTAAAPVIAETALGQMDIDDAINTFADKDFSGAMKQLALISKKGESRAIKKKAKKLQLNIAKFKIAWKKAHSARGKAKTKWLKMCLRYDNKISGGRLSGEIQDMMDMSGGGGGYDEERAKKLYMEGRSKRKSDPETAREKLKEVLKLVPKSNKYYKKAKKLLRKL